MAFDYQHFSGPILEGRHNQRSYRYRTTDTIDTVTGSAYFTGIGDGGANDSDAQVGDVIDVEVVDDLGSPSTLTPYRTVIQTLNASQSATVSTLGVSSSTTADLTGSLVPNTDNSLDLGSSTKEWRNLYVDGTASLDTLDVHDTLKMSGASIATRFTITLAASATTDGMDITIQAKDEAGNNISNSILIEMWISELSNGGDISADTYSGGLTWNTGTVWETLTANKHYRILTTTSGAATATLVDSANPADQYIVVVNPLDHRLIVSAASGSNWN